MDGSSFKKLYRYSADIFKSRVQLWARGRKNVENALSYEDLYKLDCQKMWKNFPKVCKKYEKRNVNEKMKV